MRISNLPTKAPALQAAFGCWNCALAQSLNIDARFRQLCWPPVRRRMPRVPDAKDFMMNALNIDARLPASRPAVRLWPAVSEFLTIASLCTGCADTLAYEAPHIDAAPSILARSVTWVTVSMMPRARESDAS